MSFTFKLALVALLWLPATAARAAEHGTAEEAVALTNKAVAHFKEVGKDKALEDFTTDKADFTDRDLYIGCIDQNGIVTANGMNKALIGHDLTKVMDAEGNSFGQQLLTLMKTRDEGWLEYRWPDPLTKKLERKRTYNAHFGDQICGVGIYQ